MEVSQGGRERGGAGGSAARVCGGGADNCGTLLERRAANPGAAQSDVYGTEHLLRLVAKLPSLLQDAKMSPETGKQVLPLRPSRPNHRTNMHAP